MAADSQTLFILRTGLVSLWITICPMAGAALAENLAQNRVSWTLAGGEAHFETAFDQSWQLPPGSRIEKFQFSAIRFHLGYFQIKLVGIADFAEQHSKELAVSQKIDPSLNALFELGLRAVLRAKPFDQIMAVVPAGFPASEKKPINLGLLRIDGTTQSQLLDDGPSAILCLDSPRYHGQGYQFQLPVFYRTSEIRQQDLIRQCRDAVQVGPRILEDPYSISKEGTAQQSYMRTKNGVSKPWPIYLGIPSKMATSRAAYFRTIIALDDPGRDDSKEGDGKGKDVARNAYAIVTETPVTLWEVQNMLSSPGFYSDDRYAPYWAINLVGGDYAGLIVKGTGPDRTFGNVDITQASVLAIVRR
ncbi:hypothetical protein GALL_419280 [mine drainage metagenome]|uniref:Uncharacterized protein n=1 Tax=mine drainage metagenome TaxID=410659 RepID=A0A1J5PZI9_9ZZZZ